MQILHDIDCLISNIGKSKHSTRYNRAATKNIQLLDFKFSSPKALIFKFDTRYLTKLKSTKI